VFEDDVMGAGGVVLGDGEVARADVIEASRRAATGLASMGVGAGGWPGPASRSRSPR
jgi:hypothetical protein